MNALGDVLGDDNKKIKEFFQTETDALVDAASLRFFGMANIPDVPSKNSFPADLKFATVIAKREWLHNQVCAMLDMYVMDSMATLEESSQVEEVFKCREPDCPRSFRYRKCRDRHEQKSHSLIVEDQTLEQEVKKSKVDAEDHVFNYGCLHLSLGLLLRNAEDSVKEGDGERLMRVLKFLTFIFRLQGANKYALAGLRVQASLLGLLTPRDAHWFKWNRFACIKEGPASRISRDLRLEQHNKVAKEEVRAMGLQNLSALSVEEGTKSEGATEKIVLPQEKNLTLSNERAIIPEKVGMQLSLWFWSRSTTKVLLLRTPHAVSTRHFQSSRATFFRQLTRNPPIDG